MNKRKNILPKEDYKKLMKIKKSLIEIKKALEEGKKEAEKINDEKENILIFKKDE